MRRRAGRGFFLGLIFILLWQSGWAVFALILWLLHRWMGISLFLCWVALGVWLFSALLATVLIHAGARGPDAPAPAQQNRNPYSADSAQVFLGVANDPAPAGPPAPGQPARTIVLVMRRKSIAQGLTQKLWNQADLHLVYELSYSHAQAAVCSHGAGVALIEVAESGEHHGVTDCLALCASLREAAPHCKLLLLCPERDREGVARAVEAKRTGHIDDFVFYDATSDYLAAKLLSM